MVHENILLLCNISFDPLLTKLSSWSLKCSERNWLMYSLLKLTIVYQCTCIYEVLDNRAWIRIFPSSVYNILYTFREIIQFKQVYSYPKVDMYHHFYSKDIDKKFESNTIFQIRASNTEIRCTLIQLAGNQFNFGYVIVRQQLFITRTIIRLERTPTRLNYDERNAKENEKDIGKKANI